jgi:transcriptional regulator with XRE-family HTH domain
MATLKVPSLGDYIREQRESAQVSLRQLARTAGVSNPYLSQIERGLKKPSAEILQQIAKGLRISAETLYVRAGILEERSSSPEVTAAIHGDHGLTERQKRVLIDIYETFRQENAVIEAAREPAAANGSNGHHTTRRPPQRVSKRAASSTSAQSGERTSPRTSKRAAATAPTSVRRSHPKP